MTTELKTPSQKRHRRIALTMIAIACLAAAILIPPWAAMLKWAKEIQARNAEKAEHDAEYKRVAKILELPDKGALMTNALTKIPTTNKTLRQGFEENPYQVAGFLWDFISTSSGKTGAEMNCFFPLTADGKQTKISITKLDDGGYTIQTCEMAKDRTTGPVAIVSCKKDQPIEARMVKPIAQATVPEIIEKTALRIELLQRSRVCQEWLDKKFAPFEQATTASVAPTINPVQ